MTRAAIDRLRKDARRTRVERALGLPAEEPTTVARCLGPDLLAQARIYAAQTGESVGAFIRGAVRERVGRVRLRVLRDAHERKGGR